MSSALEDVLDTKWFSGIVRELMTAGLPLNKHSNDYESAMMVKPGPGLLFGFSATTTLNAAQWILVFDSDKEPVANDVPVASFQINGSAIASGDSLAVSYIFPGRFFLYGIWLANSTAGNKLTAGAADTFYDAQYA